MTDEVVTPAVAELHPPINRENADEAAKGLISRAEHIANSIKDLSVHEAVVVFHAVTDLITEMETREKAIVKTKFEEAMMWLQRHVISETSTKLQQQAATAPDAPAAPTGAVAPSTN